MMSGGHRILMVLVGVSLLTSSQGECPPGGWEESRGSCYLFVLENRTQAAAQTACITQGGNLTSVADEEENNFIYNLSLARSADEACPSVWLGLIKLANLTSESTEEGWTWLDGSTYDNGNYSKWRFSEPGSGEYCARMYVKDTQGVDGEWGGRDCSVTFPYVCKQRATPSTTTMTTTKPTSTPTATTITTPTLTTTTTTTTAVAMPTTEKIGTMVATSEQSGTPGPTKSSTLFYFGAGVGVGVVVGIIVAIIVVVIVVKRRNKSERRDVTNSQSAPSGGDGDAGVEGGYSYVEVRPAKIMKEVMAEKGIYSEANIDAESKDVDTASEASVTLPPPTVGRPSVKSPSKGDERANVKSSTLKRLHNNSIPKSVTQTAPKPSDAPEDSKSGDYNNDPVSPTTHKVADSGDEYALVLRSNTGEMTMAPPGWQ